MKVQLPWMSEREHNRTITRAVLFCVHLESSRAAFPSQVPARLSRRADYPSISAWRMCMCSDACDSRMSKSFETMKIKPYRVRRARSGSRRARSILFFTVLSRISLVNKVEQDVLSALIARSQSSRTHTRSDANMSCASGSAAGARRRGQGTKRKAADI